MQLHDFVPITAPVSSPCPGDDCNGERDSDAPVDFDAFMARTVLPAPRWLRGAIANLRGQDGAALDMLAERIRGDAALAGQLLGLANRGGASGTAALLSIDAATLARIGLPVLRAVALNNAQYGCAGPDQRRYRLHSLAMACSARIIGGALRLAAPDALYTCGLLAGVGGLAMAGAEPPAHGEPACATAIAPRRAGQRLFGYDKAGLSGAMMRHWGLPACFCEAVLLHESPPTTYPRPATLALAWLLHLAAAVADQCLAGAASRAAALRIDTAASRLGLDPAQLATLVRHSTAEWSESQLVSADNRAMAAAPLDSVRLSAAFSIKSI